MHRIISAIGLLAILASFNLFGQTSTFVSKTGKAETIDNAGNIYQIDDSYNLKLYKFGLDSANKIISVINYGADPLIDATNALEIFVFFPSTGWVLWFDNQLNMQSKIQLFNAGVSQPIAMGRANDGEIWVFDNNTKTLKKITRSGNLIAESMVLQNHVYNQNNHQIFDDGETVLFQDDQNVVFGFGTNLVFLSQSKLDGPLLGLENKNLMFLQGEDIFTQSLLPKNPAKMIFETDSTEKVRDYNNKHVLLARGKELYSVKIK